MLFIKLIYIHHSIASSSGCPLLILICLLSSVIPAWVKHWRLPWIQQADIFK
jgi:hypothetical protein